MSSWLGAIVQNASASPCRDISGITASFDPCVTHTGSPIAFSTLSSKATFWRFRVAMRCT
jgi:hypothetical protein